MAAVDRNRKKLVVAAAVGAVGAAGAAAAYYGYSRFMSWKDALTDTFLPRLADSRDDGLYCRGTRKDADAHLQQHFQTIQDISDSTTLPQMLPTLQTNLAKNADVNTLHQRLKRGKLGGHYLTPTEKQATWNELKVETFTYTLSAVWLLPMLDLLLRIQLNILGRHLYLQNAMDVKHAQNSWGSWAGRQKAPPRLTERAQGIFLNYANFLPEVGIESLVVHMREAVARAVGSIALTQVVSRERLLELFSDVFTEFEAELQHVGYMPFLLPSLDDSRQALAASSQPDYTALTCNADNDVDANMVSSMVTEVRRVINSPHFGLAVKVAVQQAAKQVADRSSELLPEALPMAKVVPIVKAAGNALLAPSATDCIKRVADQDAVQKLCATVYACGPTL